MLSTRSVSKNIKPVECTGHIFELYSHPGILQCMGIGHAFIVQAVKLQQLYKSAEKSPASATTNNHFLCKRLSHLASLLQIYYTTHHQKVQQSHQKTTGTCVPVVFWLLDTVKREVAVGKIDRADLTFFNFFFQNEFAHAVFDLILDRTAQRTRTVHLIKTGICNS